MTYFSEYNKQTHISAKIFNIIKRLLGYGRPETDLVLASRRLVGLWSARGVTAIVAVASGGCTGVICESLPARSVSAALARAAGVYAREPGLPPTH